MTATLVHACQRWPVIVSRLVSARGWSSVFTNAGEGLGGMSPPKLESGPHYSSSTCPTLGGDVPPKTSSHAALRASGP